MEELFGVFRVIREREEEVLHDVRGHVTILFYKFD